MTIHDPDLMRRIAIERADAEQSLLARVIRILEHDNVNPTYRFAYTRAIRKLSRLLLDFKVT
jgi:hypothetical protein